MKAEPRRGRVVQSHSLARAAFAAAAVFGVTAIGWAVLIAVRGGSWWGPVHAFLAGTVLLVISGATQLFTITWAAAPAPGRSLTGTQRWLLSMGTGSVLLGVTAHVTILIWVGAGMVVASLAILGASLVGAVRRSLLRRFDLSARFYLLALGSGTVGVSVGALLGVGAFPGASPSLRLVHIHLNLVGLVGFTIIGTLPTLLATFAHHRAVSGREARAAWWMCLIAALLFGAGLGRTVLVGAGALAASAAAMTMLAGIVVRLGARGWKAGLPYWHVVTGVAWLIVWAALDASRLVRGVGLAPFDRWTAAAVTAGVGQVLLGSLAYLVPVLVGSPLAANFARMAAWPAVPLLLANATGLALISDLPGAFLLGMLWALDFGRRLATLRRERPRALS
jgi:nitrite reductase (NO-forming)